MRKILSGVLGVLLAVSASAQIVEEDLRPWSEVEAVLEAPGTLKFDSTYQTFWLARDGRLVMRAAQLDAQAAATEPAALGLWRGDGAWVTLMNRYTSYPSAAALAQAHKEWDDYRAQMEAEAQTEEEQAELAELLAESEDDDAREIEEEEPASSMGLRLLRVPYAGGELLVAEWSLKSLAASWDGQGPLELMPMAWSLPAGRVPDMTDGFPKFEIAHPLSAGLPIELSGLLRRDAIQGSVVEVLDTPETLKWDSHNATVRVQLDRGTHHGLYKDMDLYGLPPDEGSSHRWWN